MKGEVIYKEYVQEQRIRGTTVKKRSIRSRLIHTSELSPWMALLKVKRKN